MKQMDDDYKIGHELLKKRVENSRKQQPTNTVLDKNSMTEEDKNYLSMIESDSKNSKITKLSET